MGGGASKDNAADGKSGNTGGGANDARSNTGARNVENTRGTTEANGAGATQNKGMQCTVTDSVTNARVPFVSSVSNGANNAAGGAGARGKRGRRGANAVATSASDSRIAGSPDGEDGAEGHPVIIRFGDAVITGSPDRLPTSLKSPTSPHSSSFEGLSSPLTGTAAKYEAALQNARADWAAVTALVPPRPYRSNGQLTVKSASSPAAGFGDEIPEIGSVQHEKLLSAAGLAPNSKDYGVCVGGAFVRSLPLPLNEKAAIAVGGAALVTPQSRGLGESPGQPGVDQMKHMTPQDRAAVYASKLRFAAPIDFSLAPCGGQMSAIRAIASSADGSLVASVYAGSKTAQYFDARTGQRIMEIRGHIDPIVAIAHSCDGKFLLTSSSDGNVCLWDLNNGKKLREISVTSQANSVAISDDSDIVATSSTEDFVNLWESKNGEAQTMFQRHSGAVYCVTFSRRGNLVASGSQNGEVFVWGATAGDVRLHIETGSRSVVTNVSFSHDGMGLLTADRDVLQIWDLFTGGLIMSRNGSGDVLLGEEGKHLHGPSFLSGPKDAARITSAQFVACNNVVLGLTSKVILIIEPNSGVELLTLELRALVTCISPSYTGDVLLIGDYAGNHYRMQLKYAHRDAVEYNLLAKPPSKDRGKGAD